jgi:maltooligosyltrehalose synthase
VKTGERWGTTVELPSKQWHNKFIGETFNGSVTRVVSLLKRLPVSVLSRED